MAGPSTSSCDWPAATGSRDLQPPDHQLVDRRSVKTRVELANAIFEYIEIFHNRRRRHSALGYRTPIEYEKLEINSIPAAA